MASGGRVFSSEVALFVTGHAQKIYEPIDLDDAALDLENLFDQQRESFSLPNLFQTLVDRFGKLIAANVIEHRTIQDAIQKLQALFRRNKAGSFSRQCS